MSAYIVGLGAAFGATFLALFAAEGFVVDRHRVYKGLRTVRAIELSPGEVHKKALARPAGERLLLPVLRRAGSIARRFTPASVLERLTKELVYAGSPLGWDAERVVATKILLGGAGVVGGLAASRLQHAAPMTSLMLIGLLGVAGWYGPEWVLRARSGRRQDEIRRVLPDALDLLSITVEAGLGFDAALEKVAERAGGPLSEELNRALLEMQLGSARVDALRGLGERTKVEELQSFVLAMVQADVFGISISRVLAVQAAEMRQRRRQRAEEKAQKIPVKIVFPVLLCIFPALFAIVLGPAVQNIYHALLGR